MEFFVIFEYLCVFVFACEETENDDSVERFSRFYLIILYFIREVSSGSVRIFHGNYRSRSQCDCTYVL